MRAVVPSRQRAMLGGLTCARDRWPHSGPAKLLTLPLENVAVARLLHRAALRCAGPVAAGCAHGLTCSPPPPTPRTHSRARSIARFIAVQHGASTVAGCLHFVLAGGGPVLTSVPMLALDFAVPAAALDLGMFPLWDCPAMIVRRRTHAYVRWDDDEDGEVDHKLGTAGSSETMGAMNSAHSAHTASAAIRRPAAAGRPGTVGQASVGPPAGGARAAKPRRVLTCGGGGAARRGAQALARISGSGYLMLARRLGATA